MADDPAVIEMRRRRAAAAAAAAGSSPQPTQQAPDASTSMLGGIADTVTAPGRWLGRKAFEIKQAFTGENSATPATTGYETSQGTRIPALPEAGTEAGLNTWQSGLRRALSSAALLTSFDPAETLQILRAGSDRPIKVLATKWVRASQYNPHDRLVSTWFPGDPPAGWSLGDAKGNLIVDDGTGPVVWNRPGFSKTDALQAVGTGAAFAGAARAGGPGVLGAAKAGGAAAATQAGIEAAQSAAGGSFDAAPIATAGAFGVGGQAVANTISRFFPALRRIAMRSNVTPQVRDEIRAAAANAGYDPALLTDQVIDDAVRAAKSTRTAADAVVSGASADARAATAEANAATAVAGEREFGIPLTRGQRTLDQNQLLDESMLRAGNFGAPARATMLAHDTAASAATSEAATAVQQRLAGAQGTAISAPNEGVGVAMQGVRDAQDAAHGARAAAYKAVPTGGIQPQGVADIARAVVRRATGDVEFDRGLPETAKLLDLAKKMQRLQSGETAPGLAIRPTDFKRLEQWRRRFNTAADAAVANPADFRQVGLMRSAYDDAVDNAVANALTSGDPAALDALKNARQIASDYARKFRENPRRLEGGGTAPDPAGALVQRIISTDPDSAQVTQALFGAKAISSRAGEQIAVRFRNILGADSEGWSAIRQAGWQRIIQSARTNDGGMRIDPIQSLKAFDRAMEQVPGLMRTLYSDEEIGLMRRFLLHARRTSAQVVGSPPTGQRVLTALTNRAIGLFGQNSPLTAAVMDVARGAPVVRGAIRAQSAVHPFRQLTENVPALQAGVAATEGQGGNYAAPTPSAP